MDLPAEAIIAVGMMVAAIYAVAVPDFVKQILERER